MKERNIAAFCSIAAALLAAGGIYAAAWSPVLAGALRAAMAGEASGVGAPMGALLVALVLPIGFVVGHVLRGPSVRPERVAA